MALYINYQGNVVDETESIIDGYYQAYSVSINKWSTVRTLAYGQYSINFGDGDLNTQSGSVKTNDVLVLCVWTGSADRALADKMAVVSFVYAGIDNNIQNLQVLPPSAPTGTLNTVVGVVGENTSLNLNTSTIRQWTYSGKTHYQRYDYYSQVMFNKLNIGNKTYDLGTGYQTNNTRVFTNSGSFLVGGKCQNGYGQQLKIEQTIQVKYGSPTLALSVNPINPGIGVNTTLNYILGNTYNNIINVVETLDGAVIPQSIVFNTVGVHSYKVDVVWNDGFVNQTLSKTVSIVMQNTPPSIKLSYSQGDTYSFLVTLLGGDSPVISVRFKIEYLLPFKGIYDVIYDIIDTKYTTELNFSNSGVYRVTAIVTDSVGDIGVDSTIFTVECQGTGSSECTGIFRFDGE